RLSGGDRARLRGDHRGRPGSRIRQRLYVRLLGTPRDRGGGDARPGPGRREARADRAADRGRPAGGSREEPQARRPSRGGARRGTEPDRPVAHARAHTPQHDRQLRRHRQAGHARPGAHRRGYVDDAARRAGARPRCLTVLAIFGPTASGKTAVAEAIAERIHAEVVSADSAQVYRGLPILTNQPARPVQLVAIWDLDKEGTVAEYQRLAHLAIDEALEVAMSPVV